MNKNTCFIEGCEDRTHISGVCKDHYDNGFAYDPDTGLPWYHLDRIIGGIFVRLKKRPFGRICIIIYVINVDVEIETFK